MQALAPTLGTCLAQNMQVKLNPPAFRSVLALAAWRIAKRHGAMQETAK